MVMMFDTLKASRVLRDAGFDEAQADAIISAVSGSASDDIPTTDDLVKLEQRLTIRFGAMIGGATALILGGMGIATAVLLSAI